MSGRKGMRHYSEELKEEIRQEIAGGKSQNEVSREYGISRYTVQSWCGLRPETKLRQAAPLPKGRPGKIKTIEDYEKENKRLKMEKAVGPIRDPSTIYRHFLSAAESSAESRSGFWIPKKTPGDPV